MRAQVLRRFCTLFICGSKVMHRPTGLKAMNWNASSSYGGDGGARGSAASAGSGGDGGRSAASAAPTALSSSASLRRHMAPSIRSVSPLRVSVSVYTTSSYLLAVCFTIVTRQGILQLLASIEALVSVSSVLLRSRAPPRVAPEQATVSTGTRLGLEAAPASASCTVAVTSEPEPEVPGPAAFRSHRDGPADHPHDLGCVPRALGLSQGCIAVVDALAATLGVSDSL